MTKDELNKRIGRRIIELRSSKGWSQSDLARALMKDRQGVERLENGKINPTLFTLYELSKVLDVSLADFLSEV